MFIEGERRRRYLLSKLLLDVRLSRVKTWKGFFFFSFFFLNPAINSSSSHPRLSHYTGNFGCIVFQGCLCIIAGSLHIVSGWPDEKNSSEQIYQRFIMSVKLPKRLSSKKKSKLGFFFSYFTIPVNAVDIMLVYIVPFFVLKIKTGLSLC